MTLLLLGAGASSAGSGLTVIPGNPLLQRLLDDTQSGDQIGYESSIGRTVVYDHSTNAAFRELRAGRGYQGDGGADYVDLPESLRDTMEGLGAASVVMWATTGTTTAGATCSLGRDVGGHNAFGLIDYNNVMYAVIRTDPAQSLASYANPDNSDPPACWVMVFDGSGATDADRLKLYKNGTLVANNASNVPTTLAASLSNTHNGLFRSNAGIADSQQREHAFYSRALTAAEITAINDSHTYPTDNLEALYWCDEEGGDIAFDSSGNGRHGTINGTLADIHQADTGATYNSANSLGHRFAQQVDITNNGGWKPASGRAYNKKLTGDYELHCTFTEPTAIATNAFGTVDTQGTGGAHYRSAVMVVQLTATTFGLWYDNYAGGTSVLPTDNSWAEGDIFTIKRVGSTLSVEVNGIERWTDSDPSPGTHYIECCGNGTSQTVLWYSDNMEVADYADYWDGVTYTSTVYDVIVPRDESDTANDIYGLPLQYTGRAQHYAVAKGGACITGDGVADHFESTSLGTAMSNATAFTISFEAADSAYVVNKAAISLTGTTFVIYPFDANGGNGVRVYFAGNIIDQNDGAVADGEYHHFLFVSRSATDHEFFVDGVSVGTSSTSKSLGTMTNAEIMCFGNAQFFSGSLRNIRVYDDALTADEITWVRTHGDTGTDPTTTNLVAHYPCSERFGDVLHDVSGNERHAIATGTLADIWANTHTGRQWNLENGHTPACWLWTNNSSSFQIAPATNIAMPSSGRIVCEVAPIDDSMNNNAIIGWTLSGGYFYVFVDPGDEWTVYTNLTPILPGSSGVAVEYGKTVTIDLQWTTGAGGNVTMTVDGVEAINVDGTLNISTATTLTLGYYTSNSWGSGLYRRIRYYDTDKTTVLHDWRPYYPGQIVLKDLVGSNDLVPAGTEGTHWRFMEIPGNEGVEPDGSTATYFLGSNTSGKHAPPSKIDVPILDLTGGVSTPLANLINLETAYEIADDREVVVPSGTKFRRTADAGDDRFLSYAEAIT